jgi:hypothetical protein
MASSFSTIDSYHPSSSYQWSWLRWQFHNMASSFSTIDSYHPSSSYQWSRLRCMVSQPNLHIFILSPLYRTHSKINTLKFLKTIQVKAIALVRTRISLTGFRFLASLNPVHIKFHYSEKKKNQRFKEREKEN